MSNLIRYEAARAALAEARTVDEVKDIHDRAEAMRAYGRMAKDVQLEIDAAEIRLRAERRLGILIDQQKATVGLNRGGRPAEKTGANEEPVSVPTLADAGIDKKLSSRSQKVAKLGEDEFETALGELRERMTQQAGRVSLDIVREKEKIQRRAAHQEAVREGGTVDDLRALAASGFRAGCILADPPWHFATYSAKGEGRSASQHYTTNALDEIKALPVADLAAPDCVLLIWILDWCPAWALEVISAWGFEHKTTAFTWVKQNKSCSGYFMGQGYWTRANPEQCWLATRGSPQRLYADVQQLLLAPVSEHSEKPFDVHLRAERLVSGPYLELYGRKQRPGWKVWGNEISKQASRGDAETRSGDEPAAAADLAGDGQNDGEVLRASAPARAETFDPETGEIFDEPAPEDFNQDESEQDEVSEFADDFDADRDMPDFLRRTPGDRP